MTCESLKPPSKWVGAGITRVATNASLSINLESAVPNGLQAACMVACHSDPVRAVAKPPLVSEMRVLVSTIRMALGLSFYPRITRINTNYIVGVGIMGCRCRVGQALWYGSRTLLALIITRMGQQAAGTGGRRTAAGKRSCKPKLEREFDRFLFREKAPGYLGPGGYIHILRSLRASDHTAGKIKVQKQM